MHKLKAYHKSARFVRIAVCLGCIVICLGASSIAIKSHPAGNGGDRDAKTYHFFPDNKNSALSDANGSPLLNSNVLNDFGSDANFYITVDGEAITGTDGLGWDFAPAVDGISDADWADDSFPDPGEVRVDVTRGRIKSNPGFNFKYPLLDTAGFQLNNVSDDRESYVLMESLDNGDNDSATTFGIIVYKNETSNGWEYVRFKIDALSATNEFSDTDETKIYAPDGIQPLHSGDTCIRAQSHKSWDALRAAFIIQCGVNIYTWIVNRDDAVNADTITADITDAISSTKASTGLDFSQTKSDQKTFDAAFKSDDLHLVYMKDDDTIELWTSAGGSGQVSILADTPIDDEIDETYTGVGPVTPPLATGSYEFEYGDARSPSISCNIAECFVIWAQQFRDEGSASYSEYSLFGRRYEGAAPANGDEIGFRRINDISRVPVYTTEVEVTNTKRALLGFGYEISVADSEGETFYPTLGMTYYKGRTDCTEEEDGTGQVAPYSCFPNRNEEGGPTGPVNRFLSLQATLTPTREVQFISSAQKGAGVTSVVANQVFAIWTQAPQASTLITTANASRIFYRIWQYENLNTDGDYPVMSSERYLGSGNAEIKQIQFDLRANGKGAITYLQDNVPYFQNWNGGSFEDNIDIRVDNQASVSAVGHTYSLYPQTKTSASLGRTLIGWIEAGKFFVRPYYDSIQVAVRYYPQEFGSVLTPDGAKTTLLKNNYVRPGNRNPVFIHVNNRSSSAKVNIKIYTLTGRLVKTILNNARVDSFSQPVEWNRRNQNGQEVKSGVYRVVVSGGGRTESGLVVIVR